MILSDDVVNVWETGKRGGEGGEVEGEEGGRERGRGGSKGMEEERRERGRREGGKGT